LQSEYSLWERNLEQEIIPLLHKLCIGLIAFGPLGKGFLTGTAKRADDYSIEDFRRSGDPRIQGTKLDTIMKAFEGIQEIAKRKNFTPAQIAISWLLHQGSNIVPIPGTTRQKNLEQNLAAATVELPPSDLVDIENAFSPGKIAGLRYNPDFMAVVNR